jgi:hypothetical protein
MSTGGRRRLATILIVVATLVGFLALTSLWVKRQALETDQWVETSAELLEDEEIREALARFLTDQLYATGAANERIAEALPPRLDPLAGPISGALRAATQRVAEELLQRPRVHDLWEEANRKAHEAVIDLIEDRPVGEEALGAVGERVDSAQLDLSSIREQLSAQLGIELPAAAGSEPGPGAAAVEAEDATAAIEIVAGDELELAQDIGGLLKPLALLLVLLTLGLFGAAIALSPNPGRTTLQRCGLAFVIIGAGALALRALAGDAVVSGLAGSPSVEPAVAATWDIGTSLLAAMGAATIIYGLVAIAGGWLAGPSARATSIRRFLAPHLRDGVTTYAVLGAVLLLLVWWGPTPGLRRPLVVLVITLLLVIGVEALRRQTAREHPSE